MRKNFFYKYSVRFMQMSLKYRVPSWIFSLLQFFFYKRILAVMCFNGNTSPKSPLNERRSGALKTSQT